MREGKFGWGHINSEDRLTMPLFAEGAVVSPGQWTKRLVSLPAALGAQGSSGPDSIAFISSSKCTNEESYLMQKLARAVIGTNNVDNCSRYCQAPATAGLFPHRGVRRRLGLDH